MSVKPLSFLKFSCNRDHNTRDEGATNKLMKRNASGEDGIGNEVLIYATKNLQEQILKMLNRV